MPGALTRGDTSCGNRWRLPPARGRGNEGSATYPAGSHTERRTLAAGKTRKNREPPGIPLINV